MKISNANVYVLEGPDGVGKSTLANAVCEALRQRGQDSVVVSSPGRQHGSLGQLVYRLHHEPESYGIAAVSPLTNQILHLAAQADTIEREIIPALVAGKSIVLDRCWWSTIVYARAAGLDTSGVLALRTLASHVWRKVPVSAIVFVQRTTPLRNEPLDQWKRLVSEYERIAAEEMGTTRVEKVVNDRPVSAVTDSLLARLEKKPRRREAKGQRHLDYAPTADSCVAPKQALMGFSKLSPAKTTAVFDTYWKFAAERQRIFMARAQAEAYETADPILAEYKFTNVYRASDRVSQYLIRNVIYTGDASPREVFFRTILFKIFNRIETWELLVREVGPLNADEFTPKRFGSVLAKALRRGDRIYSAAYIMPSGGSKSEFARKHEMHLDLLRRMLEERLPERLLDCPRLQDAFRLLRGYPTIGDFLGYQYVIDLNYGPDWRHSEMEFVIPGPGALDGLAKCFSDQGGLTGADLIRVVTDQQEHEFARLHLDFQNLWGRRLQLIDCQNLFCEISKYARIAHPDIPGISGRTRIKQKYKPSHTPISFWYPPKWNLNDRIAPRSSESGPVEQ